MPNVEKDIKFKEFNEILLKELKSKQYFKDNFNLSVDDNITFVNNALMVSCHPLFTNNLSIDIKKFKRILKKNIKNINELRSLSNNINFYITNIFCGGKNFNRKELYENLSILENNFQLIIKNWDNKIPIGQIREHLVHTLALVFERNINRKIKSSDNKYFRVFYDFITTNCLNDKVFNSEKIVKKCLKEFREKPLYTVDGNKGFTTHSIKFRNN